MPFIAIQGNKLWYREAGSAHPGHPFLLIHGAGASSATWLPVVHRLSRHRRVMALDLPGHGRSEGTVKTVMAMGAALGEFTSALIRGRAVLVGHSMGGLVALATTLAWPERVAGLGLVCTGARLRVRTELIESIRSGWARWPELVASVAFSPHSAADVRRAGSGMVCAATQEQTLSDFQACTEVDFRSRLAEIATPTLVVTGTDDFLTPPALGEELAHGISGANLVTLPRSGHMPMFEKADALADALLALSTRIHA